MLNCVVAELGAEDGGDDDAGELVPVAVPENPNDVVVSEL